MKILISDNISLELFCKNPIKILEKSNKGIIGVLKNKSPIFYVITPYILKKIFDLECNLLDLDKTKQQISKKFSMHPQWTPDKDFIRQAALWGITLTEEILESELASFISYWQAEGCFFHHIQWQQKLARSLQKSRSISYMSQKKRDITYIPTPDQTVPNGFRGK
ncbi:primosomal protein DnaT [Buchnera aphidicola str. APS (Acyrthosiphon pisum)]|uniref:Replication restart protein DnaT n=3 Tax=Buchnera aphidicola TaxID=9 RepID=DNAT_BUCAI|nr:primosomal protein DnaT [Buchnera aphidicola]B8D6T9.1 RecName: Full=Primosomal protein 1; AltName: Full=Primosomal protein I [Buchnera aphidicola str. Tuc7 (Acyrthosiphon pisum)]B8D8I5.1 RecName: Full=Primosomal protein 1; AltName: Full=Primosomal protein I [Buchnera aphidicola str. 5A (Acyrthosiphon pisum)]P57135.1 RecName: Full=Primosomal protein 1; AltName: Full=Primosomal protein I [Buchnera aphidicola str. APS (Acyrthosiphon pisum)]pir/E84932/ primosomal protein I [imported] - Buchnera 